MTQRESFEKWMESENCCYSLYEEDVAGWAWQAAQAALIADIVGKLNGMRCKERDCRPIAHVVHEETIDKAIEIVRKAGE
jgi:hypothetical protein